MLEFNRFTLANGLKVLHHYDPTTPMVVVNTLFDVGAKDEHPNRTGFAHLFEHLMFGGSVNIASFDEELQKAGGQNNAFTSNDITNYYDILPAINLETALWLESDRMLSLAFTEKSLEVQRNVVVEEFKQRYLNQPYGDVWLELRPLAYTKHPYQWATIGKEVAHIETATMEEVKSFFFKHYTPQNAILCIAGNVDLDRTKILVEKYYEDIPAGNKYQRQLVEEPTQNEFRSKELARKVPANAFYFAFKMPSRNKEGYAEADLISDILGRGKSSRLVKRLKLELGIVTEVSSYILGAHDTGLLMISGQLSETGSFEKLELEIWQLIDELVKSEISASELLKIKNKWKTTKVFSEQGILSKALALSTAELLGKAEDVNSDLKIYDAISQASIQKWSNAILQKTNCSLLKIKAISE